MSATLDGARVRALLGDAPLIESSGRAFPVATRYVGRAPSARIEDEVARVTLDAFDREGGSILVFLRGRAKSAVSPRSSRRESGRLRSILRRSMARWTAVRRTSAIAPALDGRRKIVLATSIAETSLTIQGVRVVIDSGLMRISGL